MKYKLSFICLLFYVATNAQDSTHQKHPLFKVSGVTVLGGAGGGIGNFNQNVSKQTLVSVFPEVVNKPYYNYPNFFGFNNGGVSMLGIYLSFDNYNKKKNRYAIHTQTNVGITIGIYDGVNASFNNKTTTTRVDTIFIKLGTSYVPQYYHDNLTSNYANVGYQSTNLGLDVQQVLTTNQKRIFSVFVGLGASISLSVVSQIKESQSSITYMNFTPCPNYNYQYYLANDTHIINLPYYTSSHHTYNIQASALYQLYIPIGFNVRLGKNDKKTISHFYFTVQGRYSYNIFKIQPISAYVYSTIYASLGVKYKF
ncbi:MAG: hypothetical protein ACYDCN_12785 [Bacteroidia bacterium]